MLTDNEVEQYTVLGKFLAFHCLRGFDDNKSFYKIFKALNKDEKNKLLTEIVYFRCTLIVLKLLECIPDQLKRSCVEESLYKMLCEKLYVNGLENLNILFDKIYYYKEQIENNTSGTAVIKNSGISMQKMDAEDVLASIEYFANMKRLADLSIQLSIQDLSNLPRMYKESVAKTKKIRITYLALVILAIVLIIYFLVS